MIYRVHIVLRESLQSGRCVTIEGEHADIYAGFIRCTDAHTLLQHTLCNRQCLAIDNHSSTELSALQVCMVPH